MIVKVELHSAITGETTEIARMMIDNIGGDAVRRDYRCRTFRGRDEHALSRSQFTRNVVRQGTVERHRSEALHVWHLVAKALGSMGYGE